jgi:glycosyltransferase involved in cell wall biosynthesis
MIKLAIVTTHPIQYYAPIFKLLHERQNVSIKVFYTRGEGALDSFDPGFGKKITWDIPLLDGYPYEWVTNTATNAGSHHFKGIINPGLIDQVNAYKSDALLVIGWAYSGHLKAIRYFKNKIPVYFRGDSTLLDEMGGIKSILRSIFLKWVYRHIDHAFYNGTNNKAYFKKYGLNEQQLAFAPHAIDNDRFFAEKKNEAQLLKQSLNIAPTDLLILFAGKLEEKKNPVLLLDAVITLNDPKVHLLFTGNGNLENT